VTARRAWSAGRYGPVAIAAAALVLAGCAPAGTRPPTAWKPSASPSAATLQQRYTQIVKQVDSRHAHRLSRLSAKKPELSMSTIQRSNRVTTVWAITAVVSVGLVIAGFIPEVRPLLILLQVGFALLHGAQRYDWRAIGVFVVAGLVISNILENLSIETGFPFGRYHYTGGGKIFLVPWFIGPAYLATGYLAWVVATVLFGDVRRNSPWLITIGTPVIGAFAMTGWDLSLDPSASTINHAWIWENSGGFFGVPVVNFLGWTFTVYGMFVIAALALLRIAQQRTAAPALTTAVKATRQAEPDPLRLSA
jgi:uncharacterized membrane protein